MNKTIHINLCGLAFQIEEEAYQLLQSYLKRIEERLGKSEETNEIISDIEARIAELFKSDFKTPNDVITKQAVEEIIKLVGEPADIIDEEDEPTENSQTAGDTSFTTTRKSLYRDADDRVFAGVCGGLGAYFDVDPIVFRIIFVITTVFFLFVPPLIYVILWIAMPKAVTLSQRLQMRGAVSFQKVGDNIKQEYEAVSSRLKTVKTSKNYKNMQQGLNKTGDAMANGLRATLRVFGVILGLGLTIFSFIGLIALVLIFAFQNALFGLVISEGHFISELPLKLLSSMDMLLGSIGILLLVAIPMMLILYLGLKLIFRFPSQGPALGIVGLVLWLAGLVLLIFTGMRVLKSFETSNTYTEEKVLNEVPSTTIYLETLDSMTPPGDRDYLTRMDEVKLYSLDGELYIEGQPEIRITRGDELKIMIEKRARGSNADDAAFNAQYTEYFWQQKDSVIHLDRYFTLGDQALIRKQKVYVTIQVPHDKQLEVSPYLDRIISDF
jgi:phage shock protein C